MEPSQCTLSTCKNIKLYQKAYFDAVSLSECMLCGAKTKRRMMLSFIVFWIVELCTERASP